MFDKPLKPLGTLALQILSFLRLVKIKRDKQGNIIACTNLTIITVTLVLLGPMREETLTTTIMAVQACASVIAFVIRYAGASWFYRPATGRL